MNRLEKTKIIAEIWRSEVNRSRKCILHGCNETAINSHLLQRQGILSNIVDQGHFYVLGSPNFFSFNSEAEALIKFKRIGINEGMSLPIFCSTHDISLFKEIENGNIDFNDYKNQLLFSFRSVCGEIRKKEINSDIQGRVINHPTFRSETSYEMMEHFELLLTGFVYGTKDLLYYKSEMEFDLLNSEMRRFVFESIETKLTDVCASTIFNPIYIPGLTDPLREEPLEAILLNIIPQMTSTVIISGYHIEHSTKWIDNFNESWKYLNILELEQRVSEMLIKRTETWGLSPRLFDKLSDEKRATIINEFLSDVYNHNQDMTTKINIFSN